MIASNPHGEAPIHPSLLYELPAPSTAVVDRKQHVRAYPSSASSLSLNGTRTVRIRLGGSDSFVDPSSIRLQFTIENKENKWLRPHTGPWGAWGQVYCRSNGVELDNIPAFGRYFQQYNWNHLTRGEQYGTVGVEGMHVSEGTTALSYKPKVGHIEANSSFTCMHRLPLSLLNSGKLLPVSVAPLEIECSLLNVVSDWLSPAENGSQVFELSNIQLLYDSYTLDEAVSAALMRALMANRVLSVPVMNVYQVCFPIPGGAQTHTISSVRAFSRLAQVWLTFQNKDGPQTSQFICPGALPGDAEAEERLVNTAVPQVRLSIGPHNWPDPQPVTTSAEYYYLLTKALGGTQPNITRYGFENEAFTIVFDIKKQPQDVTSALSTRSGDQVFCQLSNLTVPPAGMNCWMTMVSFGVVAIRESGVQLLT
jgi:hypothetical protein